MVADAVAPARDTNLFSNILVAKGSASVRTVAVHGKPRRYFDEMALAGERMAARALSRES
jgi:hypothetical protein